jgi:uncharacterized protein with NRDE domain
VTNGYGQTLAGDRLTVVEQCEMAEIEIPEVVMVASEPKKSLFLIFVNNRRFGSCPRTVLSMNKDFGSAEK